MQFYSHSLSIERQHSNGVHAIYYNVYIQVICTCFIYILYIMHVTYSLFSTKRTKGLTDNCCDAVGLVAVANYAWGFGVENRESVFLRTQGSILSIFFQESWSIKWSYPSQDVLSDWRLNAHQAVCCSWWLPRYEENENPNPWQYFSVPLIRCPASVLFVIAGIETHCRPQPKISIRTTHQGLTLARIDRKCLAFHIMVEH